MILQFQAMQRRNVKGLPRKAPTVIAKRLKNRHLVLPDRPDSDSRYKKAINININIVIALQIDASAADMMHAMKDLVSTRGHSPARIRLTCK